MLTPDLVTLYQDFLPEHLVPILTASNIAQTVVVQAAQSEAETTFLLNLAQQYEFIAGVVGWVDMEDLLVLNRLKALSTNPYFKGIRPMLQDIGDVDWILNEDFSPLLQLMADKNLSFDALVKDIHLANILILARRHPSLKIVIDHCGKPDLANSPSALWQNGLRELAACNNVFIKLSGLLTQAPAGKVLLADIQPIFNLLINEFGVERVMWGSDWPVINLNGDYAAWLELTTALLSELSIADQTKIWSSNAQNFYTLSHI